MAGTSLTVTLSAKLPFWWKAYIAALMFFQDFRVLHVDPEKAANFIARHTTARCGSWRGKLSE